MSGENRALETARDADATELERFVRTEQRRYRCSVCGAVYEKEQHRDLCVAQHVMEWLSRDEIKRDEHAETESEPRLRSEAWKHFALKPGTVCTIHVGRNRIRCIVLAVDSNNIYALNVDNCALEIIAHGHFTRISIPPKPQQTQTLLSARRPISEILETVQRFLSGF